MTNILVEEVEKREREKMRVGEREKGQREMMLGRRMVRKMRKTRR
jgi:hypothetical protein